VIFIDTSFWVALAATRDRHHAESRALLSTVGTEPLVTSNAVRGETWTFMRYRYGHDAGVAYLDRLERSPRLSLAFVTEAQEEESLEWLRRHDEREYSFVEATSFVLMRALKIDRALAFDGDFAAAGFTELRVQSQG
jgi:predicted nucleic acid-binding protein